MELKQTLNEAIGGYWDGGQKSTFYWTVDEPWDTNDPTNYDGQGYARVGSWEANCFFSVRLGKSEKQTLSNARRSLAIKAKNANMACNFEYVQ